MPERRLHLKESTNLKYLGLVGNDFHTKDIEAAIERGKGLPPIGSTNPYTQKSVGLDPGFGSSAFSVCITELVDGMVNVLHTEEYPKPDVSQMIQTTIRLLDGYDIRFNNGCRIFRLLVMMTYLAFRMSLRFWH